MDSVQFAYQTYQKSLFSEQLFDSIVIKSNLTSGLSFAVNSKVNSKVWW